jgi:hypothetical protein
MVGWKRRGIHHRDEEDQDIGVGCEVICGDW